MTQTLKKEDFEPFFKVDGGKLIALRSTPRRRAGEAVGTPTNEGYLTFIHKGVNYRVHRIIYLLTYGTCPDVIDHINGIKDDNRPENMRQATVGENHCNSVIPSNNTSGAKGVHKLKNGNGYQASITHNKKRKFLGVFKTFKLADEFVCLAREMLHGEFANHGVKV